MRKNILILFPLKHIAFSPTTLGIYDALAVNNNVTIYAPKSNEFKSNNNRNILYFNLNTDRIRKLKALPSFLFYKIVTFLGAKNPLSNLNIYDFVRYLEYKVFLKKHKNIYDEIIAIDVVFLYLATQFYNNVHFLSLEISETEKYLLNVIHADKIKSVIIQTQTRYDYLLKNKNIKTFFIQNAPVFEGENNSTKLNNTLLFSGTALPSFGLYSCLNFIQKNDLYTLTIKGTILNNDLQIIESNYADILVTKKLIINTDYMEANDLIKYMAQFEIGFCIYDLSFPEINKFNYKTAPSGKMFAVFAAGVPIIAMNLDGQRCIEDFKAGVLINDLEYNTILDAIVKIKSNYEFYRQNCFKAAAYYSFDKNVKYFVDYINT